MGIRYYLRDNFLRSWLGALSSAVAAVNFRPEDILVSQADERLAEAEGHALERLVAQLYEARSRRGVGDFSLTARIEGYWDRNDTEIDLVALNEEQRVVRFGSCKRNAQRLPSSCRELNAHVQRFLKAHPKYSEWRTECVAIAPRIDKALRAKLNTEGLLCQDLEDLMVES